jgi:tight adherence protein B
MIIFAFLFVALITFGAIVFFLRPTQDEKALSKRFTNLKAEQSDLSVAGELGQYLKTRQAGNFDWLEEMVDSLEPARRIQRLILQANSTTTLGSVMAQMSIISVVLAGVTFAFLRIPALAVAAGFVGLAIPIGLLMFRKSRRMKAFENVLGDAIDMMARSLRAGHSLPAAISIVAEQSQEPVKAEFSEVFKQQNYGLPMRDALMQLLERVPSQDLRVVVTGMLVQKDTGGNLAEILDRIVHVIRERIRIKREIKTHTAQGRLTGWILCALPVVMLVLINMLSPGYSKVLFEDGPGRKMLYAGVGLLMLGGFVIRKIIQGIEV